MLRSCFDGKPSIPRKLARIPLLQSKSSYDEEGCRHAEDGCTASYVKNNLVLKEVSILVYRVSIRLGPDFIFLVSQCEHKDYSRERYAKHRPTSPHVCLMVQESKSVLASKRPWQRSIGTMVVVAIRSQPR